MQGVNCFILLQTSLSTRQIKTCKAKRCDLRRLTPLVLVHPIGSYRAVCLFRLLSPLCLPHSCAHAFYYSLIFYSLKIGINQMISGRKEREYFPTFLRFWSSFSPCLNFIIVEHYLFANMIMLFLYFFLLLSYYF